MNLRFKKRRSLYALAASALLVACSHGAVTTLPAPVPLTPSTFAPSAAQARAQGVFPLRAAAAARHAGRTTSTVAIGHCAGSVSTQSFGTLTYAVRGTKVVGKTIDATGCDVGIFIGTGDGENDNGAHIAHVTVTNAEFAGILVTDGADAVDIDNATVDGVGANAGASAGLAIDGATHVHVTTSAIVHYPAYGFLAEAGASFSAEHVTATGPGAVTSGAQAGFLVAGATQLGNDHPVSTENLGTGATPAFLIPANGTIAQSYGFYYCAVVGKDGQPLTAVGNAVVASDDSTATYLAATCPGLDPTATPTPAPTPTPSPTPTPVPTAGARLYVANNPGNSVNVFDAANGYAYLATITDPSLNNPQVLMLDHGRLYVGNHSNNVSVFDTASNALLTSFTGYGLFDVFGLAVGSGKLYAGANIGHVNVFDPANNYADLGQISESNEKGTEGVAYGNGKLYVVNTASLSDGTAVANDVDVFDTANGNALVTQIPSPNSTPGMVAAAFADNLLYVTDQYANCVYVFDTANGNALVRTITDPSLGSPGGVAVSGGKLYVSNYTRNDVSIFDITAGYKFVTTVASNGASAVAVQ